MIRVFKSAKVDLVDFKMIYVIDGRCTNLIKLMTRLQLLNRQVTLPGTYLPLVDDVEIRRLITRVQEDGLISDKLLLTLLAHIIDDKSFGLAFYDIIKSRTFNNVREFEDTAVELVDDVKKQTSAKIANASSVKLTDVLIRIK